MGTLYYGDNLDILERYIKDESVDLVYLDPPFNSAQSYNAFFQEKDGTAAASQIKAFEDTWSWNIEAEAVYRKITEQPGKVSEVMQAFRTFLGSNDMMAYLAMMAPRLVELRRALKPTGSLYLHCDPTASHYLKLLLDAVFGQKMFRNEIVWKRSSSHGDTKQGMKRCGKIHDVLFFYTSSDTYTYNPVFTEYEDAYLEGSYKFTDEEGRQYREGDLTAAKPGGDVSYAWRVKRRVKTDERWVADIEDEYLKPKKGCEYKAVHPYQGRFWAYSKENMLAMWKEGKIIHRSTGFPQFKRYLDEQPGVSLQDIWLDINPLSGGQKERLGYPTQKPVALLERIITASSNPGDMVLDPFCGCGTTIDAAEKLGRRWIGIDVTPLAITLIKSRLIETNPGRIQFLTPTEPRPELNPDHTVHPIFVRVIGEPVTAADAAQLAADDKYHFQLWALGLVGARPHELKKGADGGIDGKILFRDDPKATKPEQVILSVKSGKLKADDVRALGHVVTRENAAIGVLISLQEPTDKMRADAASAGFYVHKLNGRQYAKLQLRTIEELMEGKGIARPSNIAATDETYKRAPKNSSRIQEEPSLGL